MTVKKLINYTPLNRYGEASDFTCDLELTVLMKTGNYLLHKNILRHKNLRNQGTVSTKTRSEVRGGGRKPWKQKGTGRARAGSNRSPLWKGGGIIFGPKPKTASLKINKKERRLALQTLLYNKKNAIIVIQDLEVAANSSKTKEFLSFCDLYKIAKNQNLLVIVSKKTTELKLSTQNLKKVELIAANNLNTLSLLKAKQIIVTTSALKDIKEIYCD